MKKYQIFLIKTFSWLFLIFAFCFLLMKAISLLKPQIKIDKELKELEKIKEYLPIEEIKEKFVTSLPTESLKIALNFETKEGSFKFQLAISGNEIYLNTPIGWQKFEIKKEDFKKIENLVKELKKERIFEKFEKRGKIAEFSIDKEKLKKIAAEWEKDKKLKEEILKMSDVKGKIFYNEKEEIEKVEIETESGKVLISFEKGKEKTNEENLENLILSLLK